MMITSLAVKRLDKKLIAEKEKKAKYLLPINITRKKLFLFTLTGCSFSDTSA